MDRKKFPKVVTPIGTAVFPRLNEPDTKFDPNGAYSTKLRLTDGDAEKFQSLVEDFAKRAYAEECKAQGKKTLKRADLPFKPATTREGEEIPGAVDFNLKRKAGGVTKAGKKWTATVGLFDANGQPMTDEIWGGSKIRAQVTLVPWYAAALGFGIRLEIRQVQVIELVGPDGTQECAFGTVEGGFTTSAAQADEETDDGGEEDDALDF